MRSNKFKYLFESLKNFKIKTFQINSKYLHYLYRKSLFALISLKLNITLFFLLSPYYLVNI